MNTRKLTLVLIFLSFSLLDISCAFGSTAKPTLTPILTTPIPGWEKFSSGNVELWMPANFDGGDLTNDLDVIIQRMRSFGPEYQKLADMIEKNPSAVTLLVFDTQVGSSGFLTNVNVIKEPVISTMGMQTYLDSTSKQFPSIGFNVIEIGIVQLDNYQAGRLVVQADALKAKEAMYIIKVKSVMWVITYSTGISEFENRLPIFEKSANTIKITP